MSDMNRAIGIGQCGGNQYSVVFFHSNIADLTLQGLQK